MENITLYINESDENGMFLLQFPFWSQILAVWIITLILIQSSVMARLATGLTLLVTMIKTKKLQYALNFIHISILSSQIGTRLIVFIGFLVHFPPGWKDCNCSLFLSSLVHSAYLFLTVYEPTAFAFLWYLQLLQVKVLVKKATVISMHNNYAFPYLILQYF